MIHDKIDITYNNVLLTVHYELELASGDGINTPQYGDSVEAEKVIHQDEDIISLLHEDTLYELEEIVLEKLKSFED